MCLVVLPVLVENRAAVAVVLVGCSVLYMGSLRNYQTVLVENGVVITFVFGQTREPLAMAESLATSVHHHVKAANPKYFF